MVDSFLARMWVWQYSRCDTKLHIGCTCMYMYMYIHVDLYTQYSCVCSYRSIMILVVHQVSLGEELRSEIGLDASKRNKSECVHVNMCTCSGVDAFIVVFTRVFGVPLDDIIVNKQLPEVLQVCTHTHTHTHTHTLY